MVAVRRAPSGAPVSVITGRLTCAWLPPIRLVATGDSSLNNDGVVPMKKIVPDPPALTPQTAAQCEALSLDRAATERALDYYLQNHKPYRPIGTAMLAIPRLIRAGTRTAQQV